MPTRKSQPQPEKGKLNAESYMCLSTRNSSSCDRAGPAAELQVRWAGRGLAFLTFGHTGRCLGEKPLWVLSFYFFPAPSDLGIRGLWASKFQQVHLRDFITLNADQGMSTVLHNPETAASKQRSLHISNITHSVSQTEGNSARLPYAWCCARP